MRAWERAAPSLAAFAQADVGRRFPGTSDMKDFWVHLASQIGMAAAGAAVTAASGANYSSLGVWAGVAQAAAAIGAEVFNQYSGAAAATAAPAK
jgi:hypothetical protein